MVVFYYLLFPIASVQVLKVVGAAVSSRQIKFIQKLVYHLSVEATDKESLPGVIGAFRKYFSDFNRLGEMASLNFLQVVQL